MRDPLGSLYEFLWANPYQPGLSYALLPLVFHNGATGHVFARTSWEEDATWIGYFDSHLQVFRDGKLETLRSGAAIQPVRVGDAVFGVMSGCFGSYAMSHGDTVARKPSRLSFAAAASIPSSFLTALYTLEVLGKLRSGQKVLIHAGTGGVAARAHTYRAADRQSAASAPGRRLPNFDRRRLSRPWRGAFLRRADG